MTLFVCHASIANHTDFVVTDPTLPTLSNVAVCDDNNDGYAVFDLTVQNAPILAAQSSAASNYSVSYYETLNDANANSNSIVSPTVYNNINLSSQIIYFRVRNINTNAFVVGSFQVVVTTSPIAPINVSIPPTCDNDTNPQNGSTALDLTQATILVLAQQPLEPSNYSVSYYTTHPLAQVGTSPIIPATNYVGNDGQTIWVRVENTATGCSAISSFQLVINTPLLLIPPTPLNVCDDDANPNDQYHSFDLTVKNNEITQGLSGYMVTYYPSIVNAQLNTNAITNPTNYTNVVPVVQTIGVRVTSPVGCISITTLNIRVLPIPTPNFGPPSLAPKCDINNPGDMLEIFNLTTNAAYISNGNPSIGFHYFYTLFEANANQNEILTPTAALVGTNVWIRVENTNIDYQGNKCYVLVEQPLMVYPLPTIVQPLPPYSVCDDNADGLAVFDLTNPLLAQAILGSAQLPADFTISYYPTAAGANPATNTGQAPLPNSYTNVFPNNQIIYIRVVNNATGCVNTGLLSLAVQAYARATGPQIISTSDGYGDPYDGVGLINLTSYAPAILNGQNPSVFLVSYYHSYANAIAGTNALTGAQSFVYQTHPDVDTVWVKVENSSNLITPFCYAITTINIRVERNPNPIITTANNVTTICVDFNTNVVVRTLTLDSGMATPENYTFSWYGASNPTTVIGTGATFTVATPAVAGAARSYTVRVTSSSPLGCQTTSQPFDVIQSGQASIPTSSSGYSIINLSGVQSIVVSIDGYGTPDYEYSLDNGPRQTSTIFDNVSLGLHSITVFDTKGGLIYSCAPLIINNILIETSQVSAPTGLTTQSFTAGATLATLAVTGSNVQWYASATNKIATSAALPLNTVLVDGTTYYATQTVGGIESTAFLPVTVQVTLGMPTNEILTLQYAPNPVKNVLTLHSNSILKSVLVYNLLGQKVIEQVVNDSNATVDFSFLPSGNYMVKVQGETAQKVIKIVKQ